MEDIWKRLEAYLAQYAPKMLDGLAPPATESEIEAFEEKVAYRLPVDLRQSLLRHNGQTYKNGDPTGGSLIPGGYALASLGVMLGEWEEHRSISEDLGNQRDPKTANTGVKPFFLHAAWIPIAVDIGGNSICVDLDPAADGILGQILERNHELDTPERITDSYAAWLSQLADDFEAGRYVYVDGIYGGFEERE